MCKWETNKPKCNKKEGKNCRVQTDKERKKGEREEEKK
jgi:hypothetical protein